MDHAAHDGPEYVVRPQHRKPYVRFDPPPEAAARVGPVGAQNLGVYASIYPKCASMPPKVRTEIHKKDNKVFLPQGKWGMNLSSSSKKKCVSNGENTP